MAEADKASPAEAGAGPGERRRILLPAGWTVQEVHALRAEMARRRAVGGAPLPVVTIAEAVGMAYTLGAPDAAAVVPSQTTTVGIADVGESCCAAFRFVSVRLVGLTLVFTICVTIVGLTLALKTVFGI